MEVGKKSKAKASSSNETVNVIGDKHDKAESSTMNDEREAGQGGNGILTLVNLEWQTLV